MNFVVKLGERHKSVHNNWGRRQRFQHPVHSSIHNVSLASAPFIVPRSRCAVYIFQKNLQFSASVASLPSVEEDLDISS